MLEDSPEGFVSRWRRHAAEVELFPRTEGSPLLEVRAAGALVQLFERTGPYLSRPGRKRAIIHPVADSLERLEPGSVRPEIVATGLSSLYAQGTVVAMEEDVLVVDAGVPLVVGLRGGSPEGLAVGDAVRFTSAAPVHGFVVSETAPLQAQARRERHDDQI